MFDAVHDGERGAQIWRDGEKGYQYIITAVGSNNIGWLNKSRPAVLYGLYTSTNGPDSVETASSLAVSGWQQRDGARIPAARCRR